MSPDSTPALTRLLQLSSPGLPVGAYAYSEGLEFAVEWGAVADAASALDWIGGLLGHSLARLDIPLLGRMHHAWALGRPEEARRWSARLLAWRETAELRASDRLLGQALAKLLGALGVSEARTWERCPAASYAALYTLGCQRFGISRQAGACGLAWSWAENLVTATVKLVPLGQTEGQRILFALGTRIPELCADGLALGEEAIGGSALGAAIASSRHEHQHTRLFRS